MSNPECQPELANCPFCGTDAVTVSQETTSTWAVYCCECSASLDPEHGSRAEAVAAWNRRAALPPVAAVPDGEIIDLLKKFRILKIDTTPVIENGIYSSHVIRADIDEEQVLAFVRACFTTPPKLQGDA